MDNETVTLWTRQDERSLHELESNGFFFNKREYIEAQYDDISDYFISLYRWFVNSASKKVAKPEYVEFPIWCSVSEENMLRPTNGAICYKLEIPREKVIYFDGSKWDYVLNHIYIPKDNKDQKDYLEDLARKGFKDEFNFIQGRHSNLYPLERRKIMDSWERIYDIKEWNIFTIQGNIWEIRKEYVKEIYTFDE